MVASCEEKVLSSENSEIKSEVAYCGYSMNTGNAIINEGPLMSSDGEYGLSTLSLSNVATMLRSWTGHG